MIRAARGLAAVVAVVAAVVLLTGGIGWLGHRTGGGGPADPRPSPGRDLDLPLSYVGLTPAGPRLFTEVHAVPDTRRSALAVAVSAMTADWPRDDDYRNYLLASHTRAKAVMRDGSVTVDFATAPTRGTDVDDATAHMVIQAIAHTVDDAVGSDVPVRFAVAGNPVTTLLGVDTTRSVVAVRDATVDSPVAIDSPGEYAITGTSPVVRGRASTPDGRVYWALYGKDKLTRVATGRSAPGRCCEFTPFAFVLPTLPKGSTYLLQVGDRPDLGGGGTTVDTKEFSVR